MARTDAFDTDFDLDTDVSPTTDADRTDSYVPDADTTPAPAPEPSDADKAAEAEAHQVTVDTFADLADAAVSAADTSTGTVDSAHLEAAVAAYREVTGGIKFKNLAKAHITDSMKDALNSGDMSRYPEARAYNEIHEAMMAATKSGASTPREPKVTVSPAKVYADKVSALRIALTLVEDDAPSDAEGWESEVVDSDTESETIAAIQAHNTWALADEDERGDEPTLTPLARAAAKIAAGKSPSKVRTTSGGSTVTYEGPRRSVEAHILNAFSTVPSGTFLTVAEIRAVKSDEYGDDAPSAGAVSARLFPKSGKVSIDGVIPGENDKGVNGATKA